MVHSPEHDWWDGTREVLAVVLREVHGSRLAGIGLCGLFPAVCLVDVAGGPITDGLLYGDRRGQEMAPEVNRGLGRELEADAVLPRLVWLSRQGAANIEGARWALGPHGFVGYRLTGQATLDALSASRWGGRLLSGSDWDGGLMKALGLATRILPPVVAPRTVIGQVTADASRLTRLPTGLPVVAGATDSLAQMLGSGVREPGDGLISYSSTGTLLVLRTPLSVAIGHSRAVDGEPPYERAVHALGSGLLVEQVRTELLGGAAAAALDRDAASLPLGSDGLFVVPSMPRPGSLGGGMDGRSDLPSGGGAAIVGLRPGHGRGHLWRAVLESFGYLLREASTAANPPVGPLVAGGGGSRSEVWRQIVSDLTGWTQEVVSDGAASRGAAHLAQLGVAPESVPTAGSTWTGGPRIRSEPRTSQEEASALATRWMALRAALASADGDSAGRPADESVPPILPPL